MVLGGSWSWSSCFLEVLGGACLFLVVDIALGLGGSW